MQDMFTDVYHAAKKFWVEDDESERRKREEWLHKRLSRPDSQQYGLHSDMWLIAHIAEVGESTLRAKNQQDI